MNDPVYIPVKLLTGELGHVFKFQDFISSPGYWWFVPNNETLESAVLVKQEDFVALRSMQPEPQEYLRLMSTPYEIVYTSCYINPPGQEHDGTQIGPRADAAINLLVRYAEELEKRIKELEDDNL